MKISPRLLQIDGMITRHYDHIWDCCCDHGLLGMVLLQRKAAGTIHFVDVVAPLMVELDDRLKRHFSVGSPSNGQQRAWQVHCLDVAQLPLSAVDMTRPTTDTECSQLIVIAGVGGDLLVELVSAIINANPERSMEFLLCPVRQNYKVRQALVGLGCELINESLVRDNERFYEIIHVATCANARTSSVVTQPLSHVGSIMWDLSRADDQTYLHQILSHYQRMLKNVDQDTQNIFDAYQALQVG